MTAAYQLMCEDVVFAELPARTIIEVSGSDRAKFLHNLSTNDIKKLHEAGPGNGCEAYFTTVQGKILLHACLFFHDEAIMIDASPGHAANVLPHLDKYLITEDVMLTDRTQELQHIWVAGPNAAKLLETLKITAPAEMLTHTSVGDVVVRHVPFAPVDCFLLQIHADAKAAWSSKVESAGALRVDEELVEFARIDAGYPTYGQDITDDNLPQEVSRDQQAISFTKGCYLGQETVARIDALGHVNQHLVRLEFHDSNQITSGDEILNGDDQKVVGKVTSISKPIEGAESRIGLGYVRRTALESNAPLKCGTDAVKVRK